ncbi:PREDICTED: uncharacterized protein LOC109132546 [Camelina sativa]|uniref:Uncharacterized protein LOC109132546 n=1 Tax=Camelina sativa TaxID=90675 RepID=A0ABM1RL77_CAMSA|nr:PREDICTED: uncharacterized protein LOC109132546 [Camelina sativa]
MESTNRGHRRHIPRLQDALTKAYQDEECYWHTKSRNRWLNCGDRNTNFFHASTKTRYAKNYISPLHDLQNNVYEGDKDIGEHAQKYFSEVYTTSRIPVSPIDFGDFPSTVTQETNDDLTREFTNEEIYDALSDIGDDRAPRPDGLTARFYKHYWNIIGDDIIAEVKDFFETSYMKTGINHTNICLIPKITEPTSLTEYIPIALCNVLYKIISKCLVNRLKKHLNNIVSDTQAAFIPVRLVTDNIMIAHEVMLSLKSRKRVSQNYMAIKTDVTKAYDRVEWNFLEVTMHLFGSSTKWIEWIMASVRSVSYSVLINGTPYGTIVPERGIRQGDPLSPYLFILCADIVSHLIKTRVADGDIRGAHTGNGVPPITHLQFADDSLYFCQANTRNCRAIKEAFEVYEYYSGQKINTSKSLITFGSRVPGQLQNRLKSILEIPNRGGGGKYLELPEQFDKRKTEMFQYINAKVRERTASWRGRYLSQAARYYKDDCILDAKQRANQSYSWASILEGLKLIKLGYRYQIGDGDSARVNLDNVTIMNPPKPVYSTFIDNNACLDELIASCGPYRYWDTNKISEHFSAEDQVHINQIYLPRNDPPDKIIWHYTTTCDYTVRSGYWQGMHNPTEPNILPPRPHGSMTLKQKIWRLNIMPKLKHFMWGAISKALPSLTRLTSRAMNLDPICPRCFQSDETIEQILFMCPYAASIWQLTNIQTGFLYYSTIDMETLLESIFDFYSDSYTLSNIKFLPFWILWHLWKTRNKFIFEGSQENPNMIVIRARSDMREWCHLLRKTSETKNQDGIQTRGKSWERPPSSFIKCNYDAAFDPITHQTKCGWILRDHYGVAQGWGSTIIGYTSSSLQAEAKALLVALQQTWIRGFQSVIFEGDNDTVTKMMNNKLFDQTIESIILNIKYWASQIQTCQFAYSSRECNTVARTINSFYSELHHQLGFQVICIRIFNVH